MQIKFKLLIFTLLFASSLNSMEDRRMSEVMHYIYPNIRNGGISYSYTEIKTALTPFKDIINEHGPRGYPPLHTAIQLHRQSAIEALLELGADVNIKTIPNNDTALHIFARNAVWDVSTTLRALLDAGTDLNAKNITGHTPAQYARMWIRTEIADELDAEPGRRRWDAKKYWLTAVALASTVKSFEE